MILYQNNEVTSTRNPMIHIHINKNLWKLLIHFPAFLFFKSHNFSLRWALIIKLPMQDVLNLPALFRIRFKFLFWPYRKLFGLHWTKCVPYWTCFYLKITLSLKNREKIVKIDKKQNPLKSIAENGSSLLQCIWIVCMTPELVCGGGG